MNCKYCRANCTGAKKDREISLRFGYDPPKTNADRIRAMSDEELAEYIANRNSIPPTHTCKDCKWETCADCWLEWLKTEVKDVDTD